MSVGGGDSKEVLVLLLLWQVADIVRDCLPMSFHRGVASVCAAVWLQPERRVFCRTRRSAVLAEQSKHSRLLIQQNRRHTGSDVVTLKWFYCTTKVMWLQNPSTNWAVGCLELLT